MVHCTLYLARGVLYLAFGGQVRLVTHQQLVDALTGIAFNLLKPALYISKGVRIRHIIDDNNSMSTPIITTGNCAETLLTSRIPL